MLTISEKYELDENDIKDWEKLWKNSDTAHFFNSYSWFLGCRDGLNQSLRIWFVYCEAVLIGIIPLCKTRKYGIECWGIIGKPYTDKCPILFDKHYYDDLPQVLHEIGKTMPVVLEEVPESWKNDENNSILHEVASINPFVNLYEDVLSQVKRKEWNNIKQKSEKVKFVFKVFKEEDLHDNIHVLWEIESQSNKPSKNRAMFQSEKIKDLFHIVSGASESMLFVLYDGEIPIAHMFGYNIKNKIFHAHHMSYVQEYSKQTPGKIVIYWLICYLKEHGFQIFDFSRGETMLKNHFSTYKESNYICYYNCFVPVQVWFKFCMFIKRRYYDVRHMIKRLYLCIRGRGAM